MSEVLADCAVEARKATDKHTELEAAGQRYCITWPVNAIKKNRVLLLEKQYDFAIRVYTSANQPNVCSNGVDTASAALRNAASSQLPFFQPYMARGLVKKRP